MPRSVTDEIVRDTDSLRADEPVETAVRRVIDSGLPALPVVDEHERLVGIVGEREFIGALFPGYLTQLGYAGFVPHSLDEALKKRAAVRMEPVSEHVNDDHIDVGPDYSDAQVAEIFLHHRVLIVPVVEERQIIGVITRADFFRALAKRLLETTE
jgi:CBS domain-containing protein